jgi:transposase
MIVSKKTAPRAGVAWFGIDVSKKKLDIALWLGEKKFRSTHYENSPQGFSRLLAWALAQAGGDAELRFCMESTGDYHLMVAMFLTEKGYHVSVVNPARLKYYGLQEGRLNKTDKADAKLIAQFSCEKDPSAWPMRDPRMRQFFRLNRRRQQLVNIINQEDNRRECPEAIGIDCLNSIKRVLKAVRAELRTVEKALAEVIASHSQLSEQAQLLASIDILGPVSIATLLAEMPPVEDVEHAPSYAAAVGVQSTAKQSGSSLSTGRMSRCGRKLVRKILYMPTLTGIRRMSELADMYGRLRARGKTHVQAMVACMRKLLMIVYGVLKHKRPYKPRPLGGMISLKT